MLKIQHVFNYTITPRLKKERKLKKLPHTTYTAYYPQQKLNKYCFLEAFLPAAQHLGSPKRKLK